MKALAHAAGGPLGIDHKIGFDQSGIWSRHDQMLLQYLTLGTVVGGALWEGGESRLGRTYWQAVDSSVVAAAASTVAKDVFTRARPAQTDGPNKWFQGKGHYSFPSGEVTFVSAAVAPFVFEYRADHPSVYALGTAAGYYAHERSSPFFLHYMPHAFEAGAQGALVKLPAWAL